MSLIASGQLSPPELVEALLRFSNEELDEHPWGPLVLLVRVPADDDTGQFREKLAGSILKETPVTSDSQRWPVTSEFPTLKVKEGEPADADQVELLSELAGAPHCIVPLSAAGRARRDLLVGRGPQCFVALSDPSVSSEHAKLSVEEDGVRLSDADSKNGTLINGRRLEAGQEPWLQPMDKLSFGRVQAFTCDARTLRGLVRQDLKGLFG